MIKLKNLKLIGLLSLLVNLNAYSLDPAKQTQITEMLAQFLNTSSHPTKGFETWIDELTMLIKNEPEFVDLWAVFRKIRDQKNANMVKLEILKVRGKAPAFVQTILSKEPITKLSTILAARVKVRG